MSGILSCEQMKYFKIQLNLNDIMRKEEDINLKHSRLDADLLKKYIDEKEIVRKAIKES